VAAREVLISRRTAWRAALAGGAALGAATTVAGCEERPEGLGLADGAGLWKPGSRNGPTAFGMTLAGPDDDGATRFEEDLATLVDLGMDWARFAVVAASAVETWGDAGDGLRLDGAEIDRLARGAARARELGLKVCMIVADVYDVPSAREADFLDAMRAYWVAVARPLAAHVDMWQILNEPDGADFRTLEAVSSAARPEYLLGLGRALGAAHEVLEGIDPGVTMTTNLSGYPLDDAVERDWTGTLDVIAGHLDVITIDTYPGLSDEQTRLIPERASRLRTAYGREVVVGEIGLQTCTECSSVEEQAQAYRLYLDALEGSAIPVAFFYQLRDDGQDTGEGTFGVQDAQGDPKPSFDVLREALGR
jgi:hypothetical protein